MLHLNVHVDESRRDSYLIVGISIHILSYCVYERSGETVNLYNTVARRSKHFYS